MDALLASGLTPLTAAAGLAAVAVTVFLRYHLHGKTLSMWRMPGPARLPVFGNIFSMISEPWKTFARWSAKYGNVYKLFVWWEPIVVVCDTASCNRIFVTNVKNYLKDTWSYSVFAPVLGHGLVSAEDELWKRQRQIIARSFDPAHLKSMLTIFSDTAVTLLNRWRPAPGATSKFDVSRDFRMLTLDVICRASFGMSFEDDSAIPRLYLSMMHEMNTRIFYPFRPYLPIPATFQFKKNEAELNRIVRKLIEDRRKDIQEHPDKPRYDLLSDWVAGGKMPDHQIADEAKTMILAGHESSGLLLTWTVHALTQHPKVLAKLLEEVERVMGDRDIPTFEDLQAMKYTGNVLKETLRYYSVVPAVMRETASEDTLGDYKIPKGHFAMLEAKLVLAVLLRDLAFEMDAACTGRPEPYTIPICPDGGLWMRIRRRR
eukprot:tig00020603_g11828.t1